MTVNVDILDYYQDNDLRVNFQESDLDLTGAEITFIVFLATNQPLLLTKKVSLSQIIVDTSQGVGKHWWSFDILSAETDAWVPQLYNFQGQWSKGGKKYMLATGRLEVKLNRIP